MTLAKTGIYDGLSLRLFARQLVGVLRRCKSEGVPLPVGRLRALMASVRYVPGSRAEVPFLFDISWAWLVDWCFDRASGGEGEGSMGV
jgi:hypothetical protein